MLAVIVNLPKMHIPPWYWFRLVGEVSPGTGSCCLHGSICCRRRVSSCWATGVAAGDGNAAAVEDALVPQAVPRTVSSNIRIVSIPAMPKVLHTPGSALRLLAAPGI